MTTYILFAYNNWGTITPIIVTDNAEYADEEADDWGKSLGMGWHTVVMPVRLSLTDDYVRDLFADLSDEEEQAP